MNEKCLGFIAFFSLDVDTYLTLWDPRKNTRVLTTTMGKWASGQEPCNTECTGSYSRKWLHGPHHGYYTRTTINKTIATGRIECFNAGSGPLSFDLCTPCVHRSTVPRWHRFSTGRDIHTITQRSSTFFYPF